MADPFGNGPDISLPLGLIAKERCLWRIRRLMNRVSYKLNSHVFHNSHLRGA